MNRKKLYCQIMICMLLMTVAVCGKNIENPYFAKYYEKARNAVMTQVTMEDVRDVMAQLPDFLSNAPSKVVSAVAKVNSDSQYGTPIDEKSDSAVKQVHAAAGGMVIASGKDKELGLFIRIKHENATTVYGHLSNINVVEDERVQRGEIIGSYDTECGQDFFYELEKDL